MIGGPAAPTFDCVDGLLTKRQTVTASKDALGRGWSTVRPAMARRRAWRSPARVFAMMVAATLVASAGLMASGGSVVLATPPAKAATSAVVSVPHVAFDSDSIACPSASRCLAGGASDQGGATVVAITTATGAVSPGGIDKDALSFNGLGCPTPERCVAVAGGGEGHVVAVTARSGALGRDNGVPAVLFLTTVACPSATRCLTGGTRGTYTSPTTTLTEVRGTGKPMSTVFGPPGEMASIACVTASRCYAAASSQGKGMVIDLTGGAFGSRHHLPAGVTSIACFREAVCYVATIDAIYPVSPRTGAVGRGTKVAGMSQINALACATAKLCVAVGFGGRGGSTHGALSDIVRGRVRHATKAPGNALWGVACSTRTVCWAIGESAHGTRGIVMPVRP